MTRRKRECRGERGKEERDSEGRREGRERVMERMGRRKRRWGRGGKKHEQTSVGGSTTQLLTSAQRFHIKDAAIGNYQ